MIWIQFGTCADWSMVAADLVLQIEFDTVTPWKGMLVLPILCIDASV